MVSSTFNKTARDLAQALKNISGQNTTPYDTQAEVRRIEGDTAWVHIPGGIDETPVQLTTNAKKGDIVQVRVSGGNAWLYGNATSPPTDDTKAKEASKKAEVADEHAVNAVTSAMLAQQAANDAQSSASKAKAITDQIEDYAKTSRLTVEEILDSGVQADKAAKEAKTMADAASTSAQLAYNSATSAQWQLGAIEDVVGTLEWIATHAIYKFTPDTEVEIGKWYYTLNVTAVAQPKVFELQSGRYYVQTSEYRYSAVEEPDVSDISTYYEYDPETGTYSLTEDVAIDDEKTYYTRSSFTYYVAATGSVIDPLATYYTVVAVAASPSPTANPHELGYYEIDSYDKTVQNYISTHLSLDEDGLHLTDGSLRNRMDISQNTGISLYNNNVKVAQYGTETIIGDEHGYRIEITAGTPGDDDDPPMLRFVTAGGDRVAFMTGNYLYIPRVVVVDSMQIGKWIWDGKSNQYHLTLKWLGDAGV